MIVGASAAGLAAAEALRREGYDGALTLVGDEPHLPYDRPPLSKHFLAGEWDITRLALRTAADLGALGLELRLGSAAEGLDLDRGVVQLADGTLVPYDGLVIATGVRPRRLPGRQAHVLRTLDDATALRAGLRPGRRLVVVGAGFLGAEVAATATAMGLRVTLLEPAVVPLAQTVGDRVGLLLAQAHRDRGVELRCGVSVTSVSEAGVRLAGGEEIEADEVLVAIGSQPNTEWLEGSGLLLDRGVVCDEYCEAAPNVYAAGDVAQWLNPLFGIRTRVEHRTHAAEQGMAAARNLYNPLARKPFSPVPYFWSDQYDMKIRAYGQLRDHDEMRLVEGRLDQRAFVVAYRTGDRLTGALSVGMPPKVLHRFRQAVAARAAWGDAVPVSA